MNTQEAIKRVEQMGEYERFVDEPISKKSVLAIISQIDESQKVVVPQFVADWLEVCKENLGFGLLNAMSHSTSAMNKQPNWVKGWFNLKDNQETFAKAWLFGYEIEKEKLYTVKFANEDFDTIYIGVFKKFNKLGISLLPLNNDEVKSWFTKDELKRFKFWENPAFIVEKVK